MHQIQFPSTRMRRARFDTVTRNLIRETRLSVDQLICPVFVTDELTSSAIESMPGVFRHTVSDLLKFVENAQSLGIRSFALFPHITTAAKDLSGSEAVDPNGLIPSVIQKLKSKFDNILCIADIALDPYTSHGQDGIVDSNGYILNDQTIDVLCKQAVVCASAGADIVAPSDMMDGRIGAIRKALEFQHFHNTRILAYSAKFASAFYGPFRDAIGSTKTLSGKSKDQYQMDPANSNQALYEAALDIAEGADFLMVKPAGPYLDIIRRIKDQFHFPTFAYQVSGEYAMIKFAAKAGVIDETQCMMESLLGIKRAGADSILTYFAIDAAKQLRGY